MQPHQEAARLAVLRFEAAALEHLLADSAEVDVEVCRVIEAELDGIYSALAVAQSQADEATDEEEPEP